MAPTYKVAVIQLHSKPLQAEHNFSKASDFIRSAASQGAQLAVLPEYHLSSWEPETSEFLEIADQWQTYLQKYQELAKDHNISIVPGTIVQRERASDTAEHTLLNVAYFIDNHGNISGKYIKKNLWHPERDHLSPGQDDHQAFETPMGKVGMLICWDLAFPEAFRDLITQGAKLIVIPTFWGIEDCSSEALRYNPNSEALFIDSTLITRAFENTCSIIFANAGGPPGPRYMGLSQVTVPHIGPIGRLGTSTEGMLVVDLDMAIAEVAENNYKVRADLARDDWHYDYRRS